MPPVYTDYLLQLIKANGNYTMNSWRFWFKGWGQIVEDRGYVGPMTWYEERADWSNERVNFLSEPNAKIKFLILVFGSGNRAPE